MFPLFAAGVSYTGGKFAAGVVVTGGNLPPVSLIQVTCEYLREFSKKKLKRSEWNTLGRGGGELIHEKNQKQKISWHFPFKREVRCPLLIRILFYSIQEYTS